MAKSEGDLAEEIHSFERVWEPICEELSSRQVSVENRIKRTVDNARGLEY
jgi:hypothetical protein